MKFWNVKMLAPRVGELMLYGMIADEQFWGDEVTAKQIDADLKALGELDVLNVRINSPGGSVFAGHAIYTIIKRHPAVQKIAYIDGLAASMATIPPLACHKVIMPSNASQMIHRPRMWAGGTSDILRKRADLLDMQESIVLDIYAEKTGLDREKLAEMLEAETWMTAKEALDLGFIDEIEEEVKIAACLDGDFLIYNGIKVDTSQFKNFATHKEKIEMYRAELNPPEPVANKEPEPNLGLQEQSQKFHRLRAKIYDYKEDN
jgi:ATP-dependent Clp protease protease subunit